MAATSVVSMCCKKTEKSKFAFYPQNLPKKSFMQSCISNGLIRNIHMSNTQKDALAKKTFDEQ
uniref:Uncharacterized protein n=1 Tax=Romanomermis culicivorax TaxID=13658 RepID=A0A915L7Z6_ROMCU